jgi:hypothetical protein
VILPWQVPALDNFFMTAKNAAMIVAMNSDVCDVRAPPLTCTSPIGSSVYGGRAGKKPPGAQRITKFRLQPLRGGA